MRNKFFTQLPTILPTLCEELIPSAIAITFFCYCALEQTTMLWTSSYLNLKDGEYFDCRSISSIFNDGLMGR